MGFITDRSEGNKSVWTYSGLNLVSASFMLQLKILVYVIVLDTRMQKSPTTSMDATVTTTYTHCDCNVMFYAAQII
jgi:hypothetical protein